MKKEPDKTAEPPKRRGRPPKEAQAKAPADKKKASPAKEPAAPKKTSIWKEPADKTTRGKEKPPKAATPKKAVDKGSAAVKPPAPEPPKPQEPPKEAPRRGEEQIVYIKLDELHAFKNHPFQVRDDEEMRAMVSSVKDEGSQCLLPETRDAGRLRPAVSRPDRAAEIRYGGKLAELPEAL